MSTRATYSFYCGSIETEVNFYIHYDGYESGAAGYFAAMLDMGRTRGGWAGSFIRANELAEFTRSHDAHGDTEYRYDVAIESGVLHLTARARKDWAHAPEWRLIFSGPLVEFVNKHAGSATRYLSLPGGEAASVREFNARIADKIRSAKNAALQGWIGNAQGAVGEAERLMEVSPTDVLPEARALLELVPKIIDMHGQRSRELVAMGWEALEKIAIKQGLKQDRWAASPVLNLASKIASAELQAAFNIEGKDL